MHLKNIYKLRDSIYSNKSIQDSNSLGGTTHRFSHAILKKIFREYDTIKDNIDIWNYEIGPWNYMQSNIIATTASYSYNKDWSPKNILSNYGLLLTLPIHWIEWAFTIRPESHISHTTYSRANRILIGILILAFIFGIYSIFTWWIALWSNESATIIRSPKDIISSSIIWVLLFAFVAIIFYTFYFLIRALIPENTTTQLEDNRFEREFTVSPTWGMASRIFLTPERMEILTQRKQQRDWNQSRTFHIEDSMIPFLT